MLSWRENLQTLYTILIAWICCLQKLWKLLFVRHPVIQGLYVSCWLRLGTWSMSPFLKPFFYCRYWSDIPEQFQSGQPHILQQDQPPCNGLSSNITRPFLSLYFIVAEKQCPFEKLIGGELNSSSWNAWPYSISLFCKNIIVRVFGGQLTSWMQFTSEQK